MFIIDSLSENHCFLCGTALNSDSRSEEHVFPKWLLGELNLWNSTAHLLNGTTLPYKRCVIPCCLQCNSVDLASLEREVKQGFSAGLAAMNRINLEQLSVWMGKIYYGFLYRSLSLPADRRDSTSDPIVTANALQGLSLLRLFLQRIKSDHKVVLDPDSTFICKLHAYREAKRNFDWFASTVIGEPGKERIAPALALRHNGIGIVSLFGDCGAQRFLQSAMFEEFADIELHPTQFAELACRAFYQHSLFTDQIGYLSIRSQDGRTTSIPQFTLDSRVWSDGDDKEYAMCLFNHLKGRPESGVSTFSDVYPNGQVVTFLRNPDNTPRIPTPDQML